MVEQMVAFTLDHFGAIDILVNNAGIAGPTAPVTKIDRKDWDHTMAVNLTGAFLCAKHALPTMIERRDGRIINITSVAGLRAYALRSPYAASKWAMIGLTETLAEEAGRYNITVNAIAPGPVRGPRIESVIENRAAEMGRSLEEVERDYVDPAVWLKNLTLRRWPCFSRRRKGVTSPAKLSVFQPDSGCRENELAFRLGRDVYWLRLIAPSKTNRRRVSEETDR
jgi:NAD(P)-dependent dehydrogenase (short-subunit alcohol dehydrogenase family)